MVAVRLVHDGHSSLVSINSLSELAGCEPVEGEDDSSLIHLSRDGQIYVVTLHAYRELREVYYGREDRDDRVADLVSSIYFMHLTKWGFNFGLIEMIKKLDILKVAEDLGLEIKKQKNGPHYKGLCPFHTQEKASFYVRPGKNDFICYGCGERGDAGILAIKLIEDHYDAAAYLCNKLGIKFCERGESSEAEVQERTDVFFNHLRDWED